MMELLNFDQLASVALSTESVSEARMRPSLLKVQIAN